MASFLFTSMLEGLVDGSINFDADPFRVILVGARYTPDKHKHAKRSDVKNEVVGDGYVAGGQVVAVFVNNDIDHDRVDIALGEATWPGATIKARGAVYLKAGGGDLDELVAYIDFGTDIISTNGTFSLTASTLRIQN